MRKKQLPETVTLTLRGGAVRQLYTVAVLRGELGKPLSEVLAEIVGERAAQIVRFGGAPMAPIKETVFDE